METGLTGDKSAIRDKEMSLALELRPCHGEGCAERAVWHAPGLADRCWGGPIASGLSHPSSDCLFPELGSAFLQYSPDELSWEPQECGVEGWPWVGASA